MNGYCDSTLTSISNCPLSLSTQHLSHTVTVTASGDKNSHAVDCGSCCSYIHTQPHDVLTLWSGCPSSHNGDDVDRRVVSLPLQYQLVPLCFNPIHWHWDLHAKNKTQISNSILEIPAKLSHKHCPAVSNYYRVPWHKSFQPSFFRTKLLLSLHGAWHSQKERKFILSKYKGSKNKLNVSRPLRKQPCMSLMGICKFGFSGGAEREYCAHKTAPP